MIALGARGGGPDRAATGLAPLITPQDPYDIANLGLMDARRPPGFLGSSGYVHWLGTHEQAATCCRRSSTACASPCRWA